MNIVCELLWMKGECVLYVIVFSFWGINLLCLLSFKWLALMRPVEEIMDHLCRVHVQIFISVNSSVILGVQIISFVVENHNTFNHLHYHHSLKINNYGFLPRVIFIDVSHIHFLFILMSSQIWTGYKTVKIWTESKKTDQQMKALFFSSFFHWIWKNLCKCVRLTRARFLCVHHWSSRGWKGFMNM